jgi:hypothetical protein
VAVAELAVVAALTATERRRMVDRNMTVDFISVKFYFCIKDVSLGLLFCGGCFLFREVYGRKKVFIYDFFF